MQALTPSSTIASTMNSGTLTDGAAKTGSRISNDDALQPWQLFTLAGLAGATAVVFIARDTGPAGVILLSITVGASAWLGLLAWRTLAPLFGFHSSAAAEVLGGRTRAALEREKVLVLRSIKDLEFDRAMGKVSEKDFAEMSARLRSRAATLMRQLDRGAGYRDEIEREVAKRVGSAGGAGAATKVAVYDHGAGTKVPAYDHGAGTEVPAYDPPPVAGPSFSSGEPTVKTCTCGATNDADARFCKNCGSRLHAA
jgi:hypothetical protein